MDQGLGPGEPKTPRRLDLANGGRPADLPGLLPGQPVPGRGLRQGRHQAIPGASMMRSDPHDLPAGLGWLAGQMNDAGKKAK